MRSWATRRGSPRHRSRTGSFALAPEKLLFLPGARGDAGFWAGAAARIDGPAAKVLLGWPWFEGASSSDVTIEQLTDQVARSIDRPCALIAQSLGGILAILAASRVPGRVTHLVLAATSAGVPMDDLRPYDWRPEFFSANPCAPAWLGTLATDLSAELARLRQPTLLLWGDSDPISPVGVGERLAALLPNARLEVLPGADHDLADTHSGEVARLIDEHLRSGAWS